MDEVKVASDFTLIGQLVYEAAAGRVLGGVGIRLYQGVDPQNKSCQFLCVENADTEDEAEEAWYRIEDAKLVPISLRGLERLPQNPR